MKQTTRLLALGMTAAMTAGLLAGCGGNTGSKDPAPAASGSVSAEGLALSVSVASEPETMDPALNRTVDGGIMAHHLFENLYKWVDSSDGAGDGEGGPTAVLGLGMAKEEPEITENADGTYTWTFTLRDDAKWSDGESVTANDFVYAWQRLVSPDLAAPYNYIIDMVVNAVDVREGNKDASELGVSAPDEHTFVVDLTYNCPYFKEICAFPCTMPLREDVVSANSNWAQDPASYLCNGPMKLESWTHNAEIVMVPNDQYYDAGSVTLSKLTFKLMDDTRAMLTAFNNGELDFINNAPVDEMAALLANGTLIAGEYLGTYYVDFNNAKAPFDNEKVREAFNLAIDRNYITEQVTQLGEVPASGWVPDGVYDAAGADGDDFRTTGGDYWSVDPDQYEANCEKARQLLAEAGYPDGAGFPAVIYLYNTDDKHSAIAEALQSMWKDVLNVDVTLNNQDWNVFLSTRTDGNYDMARDGWICDYNDPVSFMDMFMTGNGNNNAQYSNSEYDAMMTKVLNDSDAEDRMELMHKCEDLLLSQDSAIAPLYYYTQPYMMAEGLSGMYYTPLGFFLFTNVTKG
ncbi:peptide ABC transporter substrate-binding protein [Pseudoflavonifractor sp. MSJ-37]|uniref:peptide ABC transporter substrate-binding protein n=1 Tax=Pseudoflavonifractor sp. MSJ-37 TaxID=2841531 RepID=UPI001C0F5BBD|nr:peptide ABC transporter substrate-binding protein [Pseudoflavonifractor sp. MSJ-37]MBU5436046.1 peptide ABC transporter substrate-binding protein [Pseudoflavonifractor sp. MSJ-37]